MANTILNFHFDYWHPSLRPLISINFHVSAFLHTGDLEAVNALLLKYLPKKIAFRFVKIRESLTCTALPRSDTDIQTFLFLHIQSTAFLPLGFAPAWLRWTTTWTLTGNFRSVLSMAWHCITEQSQYIPLKIPHIWPTYFSHRQQARNRDGVGRWELRVRIILLCRLASGVLSYIYHQQKKTEYRPNIDHTALYRPNIDHKSSLKSAYLHVSRQKCAWQDYILLPRTKMK